jgi:hypothetical protein
MEVNGVRMRALIQERDPNAIAFGCAKRRPRHLAVEGPCRKEHAGGDLDLAVDGHDLVLPQQRAVGPRGFAVVSPPILRAAVREIPGSQEDRRIECIERGSPYRSGAMPGMLHRPVRARRLLSRLNTGAASAPGQTDGCAHSGEPQECAPIERFHLIFSIEVFDNSKY